jgi:hypothetical protein
MVFNGTRQPGWAPVLAAAPEFAALEAEKKSLHLRGAPEGLNDFFYVVDGFLSGEECRALIAQFDGTEAQPVGVDGYVAAKDKDSIGSYRSNAWAPALARQMEPGFKRVLADEATFLPESAANEAFANSKGVRTAIPVSPRRLTLCGPTPYMRFMKYYAGGKHAPHYDALYEDKTNSYVTLMSWVIYLNTPTGTGGAFQFVEDGQGALPPSKRDRSDWRRLAEPSEVAAAVAPREGRLLVFPHWLGHQVQLYTAPEASEAARRLIIRGDVAYGWD